MGNRSVLGQHLSLIDSIVQSICKRHGLDEQDRQEFRSDIYLLFTEKGEEIFAKYQRRNDAQLKTYLSVVINNAYLEKIRKEVTPRWRSSTKAKRMGKPVEIFEEQRHRYQRRLDDVLEIMRVNYAILAVYLLSGNTLSKIRRQCGTSVWNALEEEKDDIFHYLYQDFNDLLLKSIDINIGIPVFDKVKNLSELSLSRELTEKWDIELDRRNKSVTIESFSEKEPQLAKASIDRVPGDSLENEKHWLSAYSVIENEINRLSDEDKLIISLHFSTSFQITTDTLSTLNRVGLSKETQEILESLSGISCTSGDELEAILEKRLGDSLTQEVRLKILQEAEQLRGISITDIAKRLGKKRSAVDRRLKKIIDQFKTALAAAGVVDGISTFNN